MRFKMFWKVVKEKGVYNDSELIARIGNRFYKTTAKVLGSSLLKEAVNSLDSVKRNALLLLFDDSYIDEVGKIEFLKLWVSNGPPSTHALFEKYQSLDPFNILRHANRNHPHAHLDQIEQKHAATKAQLLWYKVMRFCIPRKKAELAMNNGVSAKIAEYVALNAYCTYLLASDRVAILPEIVRQLLGMGIDANHKDYFDCGILEYVCKAKYCSDEAKLRVIKLLIDNKVSLDFETSRDTLHSILNVRGDLTESSLKLMKLLIKNQVKPDDCDDRSGQTPLWLLCQNYAQGNYSNFDIFLAAVRILLTPKTVNAAPKLKAPPLLLLLSSRNFYRMFNGQIRWEGDEEADEDGEREEKDLAFFISVFLDKGYDVNLRDDKQQTALMKICRYCNKSNLLEAIDILLYVGADATLVDHEGNNALIHLMSRRKCPKEALDVAKVLIAHNLSPLAVNSFGQNALMLACANIHNGKRLYSLVEFLCEAGVDPRACRSGHADILKSDCKWDDAISALRTNLSPHVRKMKRPICSLFEKFMNGHVINQTIDDTLPLDSTQEEALVPLAESLNERPAKQAPSSDDEDFTSLGDEGEYQFVNCSSY